MHINGKVEQIPVFDSQDPLVLHQERGSKAQKVNRTVDNPKQTDSQRTSTGRFIVKAVAGLVALVFFAALITGFGQMRVVLTGSMKPAINPGDLVIAASTSLVEPVVGKVVLYSVRDLQGNVVTVWCHRIIAGNSTDGFTIKGDANDQADLGLISVNDIQSVVVLRIPFIGHLFNVYSLILIFGGFILLSLASSRRKSK